MSTTPVGNGTPCPDGDVCNGNETCVVGACMAGTPLGCNDGNPCTADSCDAVAGCQNPVASDGTPCPDTELCNGDETCQLGTCTAGTPPGCDDSNECTTDTCDSISGCLHTPVPDSTPCSTGACLGGVCSS